MAVENNIQNGNTDTDAPKKKIGLLLGAGLVFAPYIAAWFLLQKGYSNKARILAFIWMPFCLLFINYQNLPEEKKAEIAAERAAKQAAGQQEEQQEALAKANSDNGLESRIMGSWKSGIEGILIDPDSAKYKDVVYVLSSNRIPFACGEVNSKNRLGGYTGYKGFITAGLKEYTYLEGETDGFSQFWHEICVNGKQF